MRREIETKGKKTTCPGDVLMSTNTKCDRVWRAGYSWENNGTNNIWVGAKFHTSFLPSGWKNALSTPRSLKVHLTLPTMHRCNTQRSSRSQISFWPKHRVQKRGNCFYISRVNVERFLLKMTCVSWAGPHSDIQMHNILSQGDSSLFKSCKLNISSPRRSFSVLRNCKHLWEVRSC